MKQEPVRMASRILARTTHFVPRHDLNQMNFNGGRELPREIQTSLKLPENIPVYRRFYVTFVVNFVVTFVESRFLPHLAISPALYAVKYAIVRD